MDDGLDEDVNKDDDEIDDDLSFLVACVGVRTRMSIMSSSCATHINVMS